MNEESHQRYTRDLMEANRKGRSHVQNWINTVDMDQYHVEAEGESKKDSATITRHDQKGRPVVMDMAGYKRYQTDMARAQAKGGNAYRKWNETVNMQQYAMKVVKAPELPVETVTGEEETSPERYYLRGVTMGEKGWNRYLADCERAQKLGQYDDFIRKIDMKEYATHLS